MKSHTTMKEEIYRENEREIKGDSQNYEEGKKRKRDGVRQRRCEPRASTNYYYSGSLDPFSPLNLRKERYRALTMKGGVLKRLREFPLLAFHSFI